MRKLAAASGSKTGGAELRLFPHQTEAFAELLATARVLFDGNWRKLPIKPRFNCLIAGGTGLGKTEVARAVAKRMGIPCFEISTATWMLVGASRRGALATWPSLFRFLNAHRACVIFIDEIDKLDGQWEWTKYLRSEIYSLLDRTVPHDLILTDDDGDQLMQTKSERRFGQKIAAMRLRQRTLVIAAGAFEEHWDKVHRQSIGYGDERSDTRAHDLDSFSRYLPRELVNRFRAKVIHLGPLRLSDYLRMLRHTAAHLPEELQGPLLERGVDGVHRAVKNRLGVRWVEELVTETLINGDGENAVESMLTALEDTWL